MDELLEELSGASGQHPEAFGSTAATPLENAASDTKKGQHWLSRGTADEKLAKVLPMVPEPMRNLVADAAARWQMPPGVILATLLHIAAGALGMKHRLRRGHLGYSCPFSMVMCGARPGRQYWMEFLAEPWLSGIRHRLRQHQAFGKSQLEKDLENLQQPRFEPESTSSLGSMFSAQKEMLRTQLILAPCAMERSPLPTRLLRALGNSLGRSVVSLNSGVDPMQELRAHGRRQVIELCRLLEMSWRDMDLPGRGPIPMRGVIHLFWHTDAVSARQIVFGRHSAWREQPPPVLLVREVAAPYYLSALDAKTYQAWTDLMNAIIKNVECSEPMVWTLSPEADLLAEVFCADLIAVEGALAPLSVPHFEWFRELVVRMAMLLSVLDNLAHPTPEAVIGEKAMNHACYLTGWLAHEHYECAKWLRQAPDVGDDENLEDIAGLDTIDMDQAESAVLDCLAAKGPLSRRELTRSFHELPAHQRDVIIRRLIKRGLAVETEDERVQLVQPVPATVPKC